MTHPLNLPNMVSHVLFEGQGWSPDHPDWLPLSLILAWAFKLFRPKLYDGWSHHWNLYKFNWKRKRKKAGLEPWTVTIVGTGKSIDFYIFIKVCHCPLLPLACICILVYTFVVYCIWSYIVIWINWLKVSISFYFFLYFFFICYWVTNVQSYGL